jgi:hypothetical protein
MAGRAHRDTPSNGKTPRAVTRNGSADATVAPLPPGVETEVLEEVLERGRAQGVLTPEDLVEVVREVELSPEVIDQLVQRVGEEGIAFESEDHSLEVGEVEALDEGDAKRGRTKGGRSVSSAQREPSSPSTNGAPGRGAHRNRGPRRAAGSTSVPARPRTRCTPI